MLIGDSAYPLAVYPTSWNGEPIVGWGFYIGGNTPHVWTLEEVARLKTVYKYILPIFTRSDPQSVPPQTDVHAAYTQLMALNAPRGILVQLDYEDAIDSSFEQMFSKLLGTYGYLVELYGQSSTVTQNAIPSGGYDIADWTGKDTAPTSTAVQFVDVGTYDLNDFRNDAPLWQVQETVIVPFPKKEEDSVAQAMGGWADLTWSTGQAHILQVSYDGVGGNLPVLRVVLHLHTGPVVLDEAWSPTSATPTLRIPDQFKADAFGVTLEAAANSKPARYAAMWA